MTSPTLIADFIAKWSPGGPGYMLTERQGAQTHFLELCTVLGVAPPTGVKDGVSDYLFEKDTLLLGMTRGYADVFKRNTFAWEYKAPNKALGPALVQLMRYALALDNPPLLIVSDRLVIEIHTHFNGTPSERHTVTLADIADPARRELLRRCFEAPESFRPTRTNRQITEQAAHAFATTADRLRSTGADPQVVAHFLTQCMFCFFAEDVGLLPERMFADLVCNDKLSPAKLQTGLVNLFTAMRDGGLFGPDDVPWFNGGLFDVIAVPALTPMDVAALRNAADQDWSAIDATIFGTLFERGLDPGKRSQLGAHYTDPATIQRLIEPVIKSPLLALWSQAKDAIRARLAKSKKQGDIPYRRAADAFVGFLMTLRAYRVLDPACGSGNFLYSALRTLKDIEHLANLEAETLGLQRQVDAYTGPSNVIGLELNEYAAELARLTVWIGELQWRLQHGYPFKRDPILEKLDQIACQDALIDAQAGEATWPVANAIVGNPPFLGDKKMIGELGAPYVEMLRRVYAGRVPGGADLVCYWFEKAANLVAGGTVSAAGLVATNSIRQTRNRAVLDKIGSECELFEAWSDQPWVNEGAAVRVSLVCFAAPGSARPVRLDGLAVSSINADLTAGGQNTVDVTQAKPLAENARRSFFGLCLAGKFDVDGRTAREWLLRPNPNGRPNSDVLRPLRNGNDILKGSKDRWVIDFGATRSEAEASMYEAPFEFVLQAVKPVRLNNARAARAKKWWLHGEARPGMRRALTGLKRCIVTVETSKHRIFDWLPVSVAPEHKLVVFPRQDDYCFGVLSSRIHVVWALALGSSLEDRPVYTASRCFDTFPFPAGRTLDVPEATLATDREAVAVATAAQALVTARDQWLYPTTWVARQPEVTAGFPDRYEVIPGHESDMKGRTLTQLYSAQPAWLKMLHADLDKAVAAAYGWTDYSPALTDTEILRRLLALNLGRPAQGTP